MFTYQRLTCEEFLICIITRKRYKLFTVLFTISFFQNTKRVENWFLVSTIAVLLVIKIHPAELHFYIIAVISLSYFWVSAFSSAFIYIMIILYFCHFLVWYFMQSLHYSIFHRYCDRFYRIIENNSCMVITFTPNYDWITAYKYWNSKYFWYQNLKVKIRRKIGYLWKYRNYLIKS